MFEKTLEDVVKGIRASKRDTALYISQCIAEIKTEINSSDMHAKANALQKLTFLQTMGYSMSWASFASIEVMSSPRFAHKRIGYLAAVSVSQCEGCNWYPRSLSPHSDTSSHTTISP
jgi:AP-3 complex subunit delta-1